MLPLKRKQILCLLTWLCLTLVHVYVCTAQFSDNFTDGDFTNNPVWSGTDVKFSIQSNQLRLSDSNPQSNNIAFLSVPSQSINEATWEFFVRLDFDPSTSNYADVYLTSDNAILTSPLNGYFVRIGHTGTDNISLFRQTGTTKTLLFTGTNASITTPSSGVKIKVTRDQSGNWQLLSDVGSTGTFQVEGTANDATHLASSYVGILCVYTTTRNQHFFFDDFSVTGDAYIDPSQPAEYKDVIITEIFADPSPVIGLPEAEFVELHNRSEKIINLSGWKFTDGSSTAMLSGFIQPNEYKIVTPTASVTSFASFGSVLGVANFPTLNNSSDNLVLRSNDDQVIDQVVYADTWYRDDDKKQGGYTLELIDPQNTCAEEENWVASESPMGGTPGTQNSVYEDKPDLTGPKLISAFLISPTVLRLAFNEKLAAQLPTTDKISLSPQNTIATISFEDVALRVYIVTLGTPVQTGQPYTVQLTDIYDCSGNEILTDFSHFEFALPEEAEEKDVLINEILFNPRPTGVDFVEVFNNANKYINLKNWSIANYENEVVLNARTITPTDFLLAPNTHIVFTTNNIILKGEYILATEANMIEVPSLPSMNDDAGTLVLVDGNNKLIDYFSYTEDYHTPFLKDQEGVSLERISAEALTNDAANWHSASSTVGFATPGYANSTARGESLVDKVSVEPEIFEPINGQPAFTQIHYNFNAPGFVANLKILDFLGREIKRIANNATLGTTGFFRWDGDTENGTKARTGYYVLWMEVFNNSGKVESIRKRIVVASRTN